MNKSLALPGLMLIAMLVGAAAAEPIVSGGAVPEIRRIDVTALPAASARTGQSVPVAVIRIDNNLPEYGLVLDFGAEAADKISAVRLQGMAGTPGQGLSAPDRAALAPTAVPGQYVWSPGPQRSATVDYQLEVMVTWKVPTPAGQPLLVSLSDD